MSPPDRVPVCRRFPTLTDTWVQTWKSLVKTSTQWTNFEVVGPKTSLPYGCHLTCEKGKRIPSELRCTDRGSRGLYTREWGSKPEIESTEVSRSTLNLGEVIEEENRIRSNSNPKVVVERGLTFLNPDISGVVDHP